VRKEDISLILLEADASPHGVAVSTTDPLAFRQRVYPLLKQLGLELTVRIMRHAQGNDRGEVWLMKKS
jgi:hypothetical protein